LPPSMSRMSENVGASTSRNPKGLHGLYRDNFTFLFYVQVMQVIFSLRITRIQSGTVCWYITNRKGRCHQTEEEWEVRSSEQDFSIESVNIYDDDIIIVIIIKGQLNSVSDFY
jgi:hypothetical protein